MCQRIALNLPLSVCVDLSTQVDKLYFAGDQTIREKPADVLVRELDRLKAAALGNPSEMLSQQIDYVIAGVGALD